MPTTRSAVTICNTALRLLGAGTITSLNDNTVEGRAALGSYDDTREALLRSHPWNFAMKRASLTSPLSTTPAWEYAYQFQLPPDCLIVRAIDRDTLNFAAWKVEGRVLLCDMSTVNILYTRNVEDAMLMPADFAKALAGLCAIEFAHQLTGLQKAIGIAKDYYSYWFNEAKTNDGQEGTGEPIEDTTLLDERNM